ncbi:hypothetical protein [Archaeoglobus sp. UBA231]|jgi:hypothetical protein|nr:hypothetical protein [Archaeoglobus sp. UBA231]
MSKRKVYALTSILSALAFAAVFVTHYYISETISNEGTIEGVKIQFSGFRYLISVEILDRNENCTVYLPIPAKDGAIMEINPDAMEVPENWEWSVADTEYGKMLRLNADGNGTFKAYLFDEIVNTSNPTFLLSPRFGTSGTKVYSACLAKLQVEIVGERHWKEYRKLLWWTKEVLKCECYKNWIDAEGEGWMDAEVKISSGWCRVSGCLMSFYC